MVNSLRFKREGIVLTTNSPLIGHPAITLQYSQGNGFKCSLIFISTGVTSSNQEKQKAERSLGFRIRISYIPTTTKKEIFFLNMLQIKTKIFPTININKVKRKSS